MARYVIGDIQGCMSSLERLLATIAYDPRRDRLWLVGDLVNRGPRSLDVLRWARAQGSAVTAVLGNHDIHLLLRAAGLAGPKRRDTLDDVLAAPDLGDLVDWLRGRPLVHVEDGWLMVHAGLHPRWTAGKARLLAAEIEDELRGPRWRKVLGQVRGDAAPWREELTGGARTRSILAYLLRVRECDAAGVPVEFDGPPEQAPPGAMPWYAFPGAAWRDHTVLFGHWAAHGLRLGDRWIATDAGCVWGGRLAAVRLEDLSVVTVDAVETGNLRGADTE
ncbi:MAG TPA: symmetrical bis(5'-nucleosyl)-tetraphosphatase [Kofleriaceae bacterium]|nr:symmetrical bis(5'-nucleosyl)-tetraphosphatase [Kofleriaceae bacterium]